MGYGNLFSLRHAAFAAWFACAFDVLSIARKTTFFGPYFSASLITVFSVKVRFQKGHCGLAHSRTTTLPLKSASATCLPSESGRLKGGAAAPITAFLMPS